jgi:tripartite-type tricarboxylate transporter receptor subunit TctC
MIKAGKVRSLAVTSATRAQLLREVPSLNELGYKDVDASVIFGIMAPKGTPGIIVSRLNIEINSVLATPSARQTLSALGADSTVYGGDSKIFSAFLWQERQKWSKVVKDSGARVD